MIALTLAPLALVLGLPNEWAGVDSHRKIEGYPISFALPVASPPAFGDPDAYPPMMKSSIFNMPNRDELRSMTAILDLSPEAQPDSGSGLAQSDTSTNQREDNTASLVAGHQVLNLDFDLAAQMRRSHSLQAAKDVYSGERLIGRLDVHLDGVGRILVSVQQLEPGLREQAAARIESENSLVSLGALRAAGVDLRYDPLRDAFVLNE